MARLRTVQRIQLKHKGKVVYDFRGFEVKGLPIKDSRSLDESVVDEIVLDFRPDKESREEKEVDRLSARWEARLKKLSLPQRKALALAMVNTNRIIVRDACDAMD